MGHLWSTYHKVCLLQSVRTWDRCRTLSGSFFTAVLLTIRSSGSSRSGQRVEFLLDMVGHSSRKEVRVPYCLCETKTGHGKLALVTSSTIYRTEYVENKSIYWDCTPPGLLLTPFRVVTWYQKSLSTIFRLEKILNNIWKHRRHPARIYLTCFGANVRSE